LARSRAITSGSDAGVGSRSSSVLRMPAGTAACISSSSDSKPSPFSIAARSPTSGPMCRVKKGAVLFGSM
jgi:hypothetical protein